MEARTRISQPGATQSPGDDAQPVIITGLDLSIWNMTKLLVKLSIASIPAAMILFLFWCLLFSVFAGGVRSLLN